MSDFAVQLEYFLPQRRSELTAEDNFNLVLSVLCVCICFIQQPHLLKQKMLIPSEHLNVQKWSCIISKVFWHQVSLFLFLSLTLTVFYIHFSKLTHFCLETYTCTHASSLLKYSIDFKGYLIQYRFSCAVNCTSDLGLFILNHIITTSQELIITSLNLSTGLSLKVSWKVNVVASTFKIRSFSMHTRCKC